MQKKTISYIFILTLIIISALTRTFYIKKNQSSLNALKKKTATFESVFAKNFTIHPLSNYSDPQIIIFEDQPSLLKEEVPINPIGRLQKNQIRIAHLSCKSPFISLSNASRLNSYFDATIVPSPFLIDEYLLSGVNIPIFCLPLALNLQDFLDKPLKTKRNPTFVFGNIGTSIDLKNQINLIQTFAKAFSKANDIKLHIHSLNIKAKSQKKITKVMKKLNCKNIIFTCTDLNEKAYLNFFQSLDCYVSLTKGEYFSARPHQAAALGIPAILSTNQPIPLIHSKISEPIKDFSDNPLFSLLPFNYKEEDLIKTLHEVYSNYDSYLKNSLKSREISSSYDYSNPNTQKLYATLKNPKKVVLGLKNEISSDYLITNSIDFYKKYCHLESLQPSSLPSFPSSETTSVSTFLKPLELTENKSGLDGINCIYVINLDKRHQRWERTKKNFNDQGLFPNRVSAINGWNIPIEDQVLLADNSSQLLSGGALGCLLTHISVYQDAVNRGFETVWICEDDVEFKGKAEEIPDLIKKLTALDPDWDLFYTDYSTKGLDIQNYRPQQAPYNACNKSVSEEFMKMHGRFNLHSVIFSKKGLAKVYDYFTHVSLWSPIDVDIHYIPNLREYSVKKDIVTSINDSSILSTTDSSDTHPISSLNTQ